MKVFIAGARAIKYLNDEIKTKLQCIADNNFDVLVGDADGVDALVQMYFADIKYSNIKIYASNGKARNNYGDWAIHAVPVTPDKKGFDFYAQKDISMANDADTGLMIWNGESKGTLNNIYNLVNQNKKARVYLTTREKTFSISCFEDMNKLIATLGSKTEKTFYDLIEKNNKTKVPIYEQISL